MKPKGPEKSEPTIAKRQGAERFALSGNGDITVKLTKPDYECVTARCMCHFEIFQAGKQIASVLDKDALEAVKRLFRS